MSELKGRIRALAKEYSKEIISIRRHIHQHPELSFEEYETAKFIETKLADFGVADVARIANTGVTTIINSSLKDKTVALRADMDALPIMERNDVPYKSVNPGVMHACGHDVHTAALLGATRILNELSSEIDGAIKIIFQPGEEKVPGGASVLIKEGILKNPTPNAILGQHVMPHIPVGKVGFRSGKYMASADEIYLTVKGKGGHAARPEANIDPISISAQLISSLQQIVSRNADPKIPSVLSFGKIIGEGATNVIPDEVRIEGTFRTFDEEWRSEAHQRIKIVSEGIVGSLGGECVVEIRKGYPYLENNPEYTEKNRLAAQRYLGTENVLDIDQWMAGEDFSFYTHHIPGCFYRLGTGNESKGISSGVHTPTFDIDEEALEIGMGLMSWLTVCELNGI